ncbi:hypothetical protein Tco_0186510 [Tanacetum coccineum]
MEYKIKKSIDEPPMDLELKPLPKHLEYAFLEEPSFLHVIISSQLFEQNKEKLVYVHKRHKQDLAWKTIDIHDVDNFKRCGTSITFDVGYRLRKDLILHRSSINNGASLSNKFGGFYFSFKFGISSLLHYVVTAIADRIRELLEYMCVHNNDASESSKPS